MRALVVAGLGGRRKMQRETEPPLVPVVLNRRTDEVNGGEGD